VALKVHIVARGGKSLYCVAINCKPNGWVSFEDTRCVLGVKKNPYLSHAHDDV